MQRSCEGESYDLVRQRFFALVGVRLQSSFVNTIFIRDLRLSARVGGKAWERELPQTVCVDLEIGSPSSRAFETGELADAIDYEAVVARLRAFAAENTHPLLERFAESIAGIVLDEFGAQSVKLRASKLGPLPGVREIGIAIERECRDRAASSLE
jgi:dihydroneopterin aldolase